MSNETHKHVNRCPMSKVNNIGQSRVKSCPSSDIGIDQINLTPIEFEKRHMLTCDNIGPLESCEITSTEHLCENIECRMTHQLDIYKELLENTKTELAAAKLANTQFRMLLMMPATAERLIHKGTFDFSGINSMINNHRKTWDSMEDTTILYMIEFHQKFMEKYSEYANERNSRVRIKELVVQKRKDETKTATVRIQEQENKKAEDKKAKTPYGKAFAEYTKMGMDETNIRQLLATMGLKEI